MIKKFNNFDLKNESSTNNLDEFYKKYKKVFMDQREAEEGEELGDGEIFTEIGELISKYGLKKEDLKTVIDNYDTRFDYLKTLEWEYKEWDDDPIGDKWNEFLDFLDKNKNLDRKSLVNKLSKKFDTPWPK